MRQVPAKPRKANKANPEQLLQEYASGVTLPDLAKRYGMCRATIYQWLLGCTSSRAEHRELIQKGLIARIAHADEMLENATDKIDIMRARELARYTRMDFERRCPELYAPKQYQQADTTINVIVQRERQATVIDATASHD